MANDPGHWVCHRPLGAGGFGIVQLWRNDYTNEMIAIKICKSNNDQLTKKQKERWLNEVKTMTSLQHPNIVETRTVPTQLQGLQNPLPVLCMEYCNRGDLKTLLNQTSNCCGVRESEAYKIMRDVASAVEYLHSRNFTHRDLKPDNIVIQRYGEKVTYKLTDLGYVCELGDMTIDRSVVGTLNYLAPELLWKDGYTRSVDYWSLGILFYEIITGNRPFFPDMHVTPTWINYVKRKSDNTISARMEENTIKFSDEIENPTTISECMRSELTNWFRLVLKWDPKKRGKMKDSEGIERTVVFGLLQPLLSRKIIYMFVVPLYRLDSYVVDPQISVADLQILIHEKTRIEVFNQIISDTKCNVLNDPKSLVFNCIEDSYLIVFHKNGPHVDQNPVPIVPSLVQRILENRKALNHDEIDRCYSTAVFFIYQEQELFRSYIIALSINIDLNNMALDNLCNTVNALRDQANELMKELTMFEQSSTHGRMTDELREHFVLTRVQTQKLLDDMKKETFEICALSKQFEDLKKISENTVMEKWTSLHGKATDLLESIRKMHRMQPKQPKEMARLVFDALKLCEEQLRCSEIDFFVSRIKEYATNIKLQQKALSSFQGLLDHCRKSYEEITKKAIEEEDAFPMIPTDAVICDNTSLSLLLMG
ncbi:inhibitor of nuclear factor kappa-B kinase subunit alpha-like isoform X2 [Venturia canescens]|uniref:inhibitor of nuclear factor kappa-B kinase subunit alpha-like isoform X2 n=1 Tax=Venturia canescens TaxID=32260 RepID=UPI001C9CE7C8|nr:inhibitor of nuclear factor kappa-B kinase subunit alpha-like isoform X2 [Venturia canescens]